MGMSFERLQERARSEGRELNLTARAKGEVIFANGEVGRFTSPPVTLGNKEPSKENIAREMAKLPPAEQRFALYTPSGYTAKGVKFQRTNRSATAHLTAGDVIGCTLGEELIPQTPASAGKGKGKNKGKDKPETVPTITREALNNEPAEVTSNGQA